jgi:formylglycine-generating enzyme required for sulfatase activity
MHFARTAHAHANDGVGMPPGATPNTNRRPAALICIMAFVLLLVAGCSRTDEAPPPAAPAPAAAPEVVTTKTGIEMVLLPAGEFLMGDAGGEDDEKPIRKVHVSAFYIDRTEVTQKAYQELMGRNPAKFPGPDRPVERVSWLGAAQFCNMRALKEGLRPCYDPKTLACDFAADGYRLPTEAEWEYACRAGTATRYSFGGDAGQLAGYAWFKTNAGKATHPVRAKTPNPWGLFDMHGNVAEWCNDFYADGYAAGDAQDPRGPASGQERVLRGGSWSASAEACRSSARAGEAPGLADVCFGYEAYGFRCVRRAPSASP